MGQEFTAGERHLLKLGTHLVSHSHSNLHTHLVGVYKMLKRWGCPERVALAGLFHSVYSTDEFHGFALPMTERGQIKNVIGEQAERLVYIYSVATNESLRRSVVSGGKPQLVDRLTAAPLEVSEQEFTDLLWLRLANNLEVKAREIRVNGTGVLRRANFWRQVAERLGDKPRESWHEVYGVNVGGASDSALEWRWHASRIKRILIWKIKGLFGTAKRPFKRSA